MAFDLTAFDRRGVPVPALRPIENEPDLFGISGNDHLPDPMDMIQKGALVVANVSGGKDGQAMLIHLIERLHVPREQIVVIHADLGRSEWEGTEAHARASADAYGLPFLVCRAQNKDGEVKELIEYADARGKFPDTATRWCTSDFKRGPIRRTINAYRNLIDHQSPYVLNCMGIRSEESSERAKYPVLEYVQTASCPAAAWPDVLDMTTRARPRYFFDWHPILHLTEAQVFATIAAAGQHPHWAYTSAGARRLSCLVCIYSSEEDIRAAARHSPKGRAYIRDIIRLEEKHKHTILPLRSKGRGQPPVKRWLREIVGDLIVAA